MTDRALLSIVPFRQLQHGPFLEITECAIFVRHFCAIYARRQHSDEFSTWREFNQAKGNDGEVLVRKRVRGLADWSSAAQEAGLRLLDVIRGDRDPVITTPENDVVVLEKP